MKQIIIPRKIYPPLLYFPRWVERGFRLKAGYHNKFHAVLYDKNQFMRYGEKAPKVQEAWAYNVFCNQGLDKIRKTAFTNASFDYGMRPHTFMEYCGIGTGSGTPAITDTTFFTYLSYADKATDGEVANNDTNSINHTTEEYYHRHKFFWDVDEGNGNLTEVGLCYDDSGFNHVISHAMFQDAFGTPITIVKDNTKVMVVTVTVYLERGTSDSGAVILNDMIDKLISSNNAAYNYGLVWKEQSISASYRYGYIYLGDTDQAVNRADCYEADYPVLGLTRSYKVVASSAASGSGYGVIIYSDWDLGEGNGDWYEVGYRLDINNTDKNFARFDLPSGLIGDNYITKDSSKKLRVTLEIYLTQ